MIEVYESENFVEIGDTEMTKERFRKIEKIISELDCEVIDFTIDRMLCLNNLNDAVKEMDSVFKIHILLKKRGKSWQPTLI